MCSTLLATPPSKELRVLCHLFFVGPSANKVPLRYVVALRTWFFESSPLALSGQVFLLALHLQIGAAFLWFFISKCCLSGLVVLTAVCIPSSMHSQQLFSSHFIRLGLNFHNLYALS